MQGGAAAEAAAREMGAPAMRRAQAELERLRSGGDPTADTPISPVGTPEEIEAAETKVRQVGADKDTQMQNLLRASMGMEPVRKMLGTDGKPLRVSKKQKRYIRDAEGNVIESETIDDPNVGLAILEDADARRQRKFSEKFTETIAPITPQARQEAAEVGISPAEAAAAGGFKIFFDKDRNVAGFTGSKERAREASKSDPRLADFFKRQDAEKQSARADAVARITGQGGGMMSPTRELPEVIGKGKDPIVEAARGMGTEPTDEAKENARKIVRDTLIKENPPKQNTPDRQPATPTTPTSPQLTQSYKGKGMGGQTVLKPRQILQDEQDKLKKKKKQQQQQQQQKVPA